MSASVISGGDPSPILEAAEHVLDAVALSVKEFGRQARFILVGNKEGIKNYLKHLDKEEKNDTKFLGLAIWLLKIKK